MTPDDAGCQQIMAQRLKALGFRCEHLRFGEVDNLWAERGDGGPLVVFAGHTDVVPPGSARPGPQTRSNLKSATARSTAAAPLT